ncbi:MAG: isoprenyl transferase [Pyrinomonadaceae bacterium]
MLEDFAKIVKPESVEAELLARIDWQRLPSHVAVIMDGNGRWARARNRPRVFGHRAGVESVRAIVDTSARLGLKAVTLYAFSTENWKRPADEIGALMQMLKRFLRSELKTLHKNNIRFQAIGKIDGLREDVQKELRDATAKTCENTGTILSVALNYGGRAEIVEACRNAVKNLARNGKSIDDLSEKDISENLYTRDLPEVDLLIRTSGELRISNFLLWQLAYSEIYVTPTLFPDFRLRDFLEAIVDYQKRDRRFGGIENK